MQFKNTAYIIMGGTTGLGLAAAIALKERGANLLVVGKDVGSRQRTEDILGNRCAFLYDDATKPKIFASAGWGLDAGLFATFGLGIVNFASTWVSILIIDRYGRRPLYIIGSAGMTAALLGLTLAGFLGEFTGLLVLLLIMTFIIFFGACVGPVFWTYMSEIFPNRIRGTAMSIPVFTQWIFNAFIVLVFPAMLSGLSTGPTFGILAFFALGQLLFAIKYMKETKGKSLEEIELMWAEDLKD